MNTIITIFGLCKLFKNLQNIKPNVIFDESKNIDLTTGSKNLVEINNLDTNSVYIVTVFIAGQTAYKTTLFCNGYRDEFNGEGTRTFILSNIEKISVKVVYGSSANREYKCSIIKL